MILGNTPVYLNGSSVGISPGSLSENWPISILGILTGTPLGASIRLCIGSETNRCWSSCHQLSDRHMDYYCRRATYVCMGRGRYSLRPSLWCSYRIQHETSKIFTTLGLSHLSALTRLVDTLLLMEVES